MDLYKWRRKILYQKPIPIDASFLQAKGVAISVRKKEGLQKQSFKNRLPRLNALAFRLAMTKVAIDLLLAMTSKLAVIMHIQDIDFLPLFRQNYYCGRIEGIYR
jgi:hypothetical protein